GRYIPLWLVRIFRECVQVFKVPGFGCSLGRVGLSIRDLRSAGHLVKNVASFMQGHIFIKAG
ncbi:hypothetical protein, partial [Aeromonas dhakensis]|uniref:hypothetical protein n=1 Tax=Aeromonas dhakensis TaxID=196024 RepID=UPI00399FEB01